MPTASLILLAIGGLLLTLAVRGYLRDRALTSQYRTWLIIAGIFSVVAVCVSLID